MVTRNDVARRANVSPSVVSYVLNNSNYVSSEKRAAVLQAIKELNYIPNQYAKNLRKGRSRMIAVIRGSQMNDLFNNTLFYMEKIATELNYQLSSLSVLKTDEYFATGDFVENLIGRHYDAIFSTNSSLTESQINRLSHYTKVLIYTTRDYASLSDKVSQIIPDYRTGVHEAVDYLIKMGHTRISMLPNIGYPIIQFSSAHHRYAGFSNAMSEHGLEPDLRYMPPSAKSLSDINTFIKNMFNPLITPEPPTVICADEPFVLAYALKVLRSIGVSVPEDVSLFGLSHSYISEITNPELTSIGFSSKDLAASSIEMLRNLIHGEKAEQRILPLKHFDGESVAPPR